MPELQQAVEDVAAAIPTVMLRDAFQNVCKCAQAFLEASGEAFLAFCQMYLKNDDSQLFSTIFEFEIQ